MKNSKFVINVWDLLLSSGKRDEISFKNETISELQWLTKDWINGKVIIQSFDTDSLLVTLEDLTCTIKEPCDICTKEYERKVEVKTYSAKFEIEIEKDYEWDDEIFPIDKNETIDIKNMVMNAILLQEPFTKKCENCTKIDEEEFEWTEWEYNELDEEDTESFWSFWNINFR